MSEIMSVADKHAKEKWDRIYTKTDPDVIPAACEVLVEFQHLLPPSGTALDVACGLGGNTLFLAEHHLNVTATDISSVAVERINQWQNPLVTTRCAAIDSLLMQQVNYDVIVVSRYLDRNICDALAAALRSKGLLFYQTFIRDKVNCDEGPSNPDYLLASNELLTLFSTLKVLAFSDQGKTGTLSSGFRNQSYLVAQRK